MCVACLLLPKGVRVVEMILYVRFLYCCFTMVIHHDTFLLLHYICTQRSIYRLSTVRSVLLVSHDGVSLQDYNVETL